VPVSSASPYLFHKTTQRHVYEERSARHSHADDALLVNERGEVTETTRANVAALIDGAWWTPPLESGLLPGVERSRLLELGQLRERVLTIADLERAEGVAIMNSLRGWQAAVVVSCEDEGRQAAVTK
jgi:para-aminobenzoate synthetase/4-amino-4-deoxychorismate lyase